MNGFGDKTLFLLFILVNDTIAKYLCSCQLFYVKMISDTTKA